MSICPHIKYSSPDFPGDSTSQPPFGFRDTLKSLVLWSIGIPHLAAWSVFVTSVAKFADTKKVDSSLKLMSRMLPKFCGVNVKIHNRQIVDPKGTYVYVFNHVNIFDMFVIYQSIPTYTRSLEHIDHFSWPLIGPLISAAGQIPVDPKNPRTTAKGLKKAAQMLTEGDSLVVLPEGSRTLDGSVGRFFPGAFRLAINARVPVVPVAIKGARAVNRRGDWRIKRGNTDVYFCEPICTKHLKLKSAPELAERSRQAIISQLQQNK